MYHFTRIRNLEVMAHFDTLLSSYRIHPHEAGERRIQPIEVEYGGNQIMINAHLRIPEFMVDASTTLEAFRATLDRHVFFWPTKRDCLKMLDTYTRREPSEAFAILELEASALLTAHYDAVKLSKYDSGSAPRFPKHCTYRKSPSMFLPLKDFGHVEPLNTIWPKKASDIKEILIEEQVTNVSSYLRCIYVQHDESLPAGWRSYAMPLQAFGS